LFGGFHLARGLWPGVDRDRVAGKAGACDLPRKLRFSQVWRQGRRGGQFGFSAKTLGFVRLPDRTGTVGRRDFWKMVRFYQVAGVGPAKSGVPFF